MPGRRSLIGEFQALIDRQSGVTVNVQHVREAKPKEIRPFSFSLSHLHIST